MVEVEGITRKWGSSSLVLVIPKEIAEKEHLKPNQRVRALILKDSNVLVRTFGKLKHWKKPTEQIMREIDKEYWQDD